MEQCLYHPKFGYYAVGAPPIGQKGDFVTNVSIGKTYGYMMARQFGQIWRMMGQPPAFSIMEQGAHDGQFADDVLEWLKEGDPDFFEAVNYWIVEPGEKLRNMQRQRLIPRWGKERLQWNEDMAEIDDGTLYGVLFCNELLDAFPVHLVTWRSDGWCETYVDHDSRVFTLTEGEPSTAPLRDHLRTRMPQEMPNEPYRTEVNILALRWIEEVARILKRGYVLICDYGMPRSQYLIPGRYEGTLSCYYNHRRIDDYFMYAGNCDLTAHVDFTTLVEQGLLHGLNLTGYVDQYRFMIGLGEDDLLEMEARGDLTAEDRDQIQAFKSLMHPDTMGTTFKFLALDQEMDGAPTLMGFRHARDPYEALEIELSDWEGEEEPEAPGDAA